jgi:hypothetical protein
MVPWPFEVAANGLPVTVRDNGARVMFFGNPVYVPARLRRALAWQ